MAMELPRPKLGNLPLGLLDFFGVKSMGSYPDDLGNVIQPTLDVLKWMAMNTCTELLTDPVRAGFNTVGLASFTTGTDINRVPAGEVWLVEHYCVRASLAADQLLQLQAMIGYITNGVSVAGFGVGEPITVDARVSAAAAGIRARADTTPFILGPEGGLRFAVHQAIYGASGSISIAADVKFRRFRL